MNSTQQLVFSRLKDNPATQEALDSINQNTGSSHELNAWLEAHVLAGQNTNDAPLLLKETAKRIGVQAGESFDTALGATEL